MARWYDGGGFMVSLVAGSGLKVQLVMAEVRVEGLVAPGGGYLLELPGRVQGLWLVVGSGFSRTWLVREEVTRW